MMNRLLVVDDDPTIRNLMAAILRRHYEVVAAASGEEALALAAQQPPAVVLLDIMMPGIDGYETCRKLKSIFLGKGIQVIMVSAASSQDEQRRAFEAGADAYLVKPFDPYALLSEVRMHFRLRDAVCRLQSMEAEMQSQRGAIDRIVEDRNHEVVATQDVAVFALAKLAESRDEDTGQHLLRVRAYAQALSNPKRGIGVLSHVVLPSADGRSGTPGKFADTAVPYMLQLLREMAPAGDGLVAKIAGGASMFGRSMPLEVGENNVRSIVQALEAANIRIAGRDVGGGKGRRVTLDCSSGALLVEVLGRPALTL
jgi:DNA-binding response OmpR family regulator/chemotaxis receptor (MCP) glutamine deamidase CheD